MCGSVKCALLPCVQSAHLTEWLLYKLRQFSGALGVQYLDMPNFRGRNERRNEEDNRKPKLETNFDFSPTEEVGVHGTTKEAETRHGGSHRNGEAKPKPTKIGGGKAGKTKTQTWFDVVKSLKIEDELETTNSGKSWNESEAPDSERCLIQRSRIN